MDGKSVRTVATAVAVGVYLRAILSQYLLSNVLCRSDKLYVVAAPPPPPPPAIPEPMGPPLIVPVGISDADGVEVVASVPSDWRAAKIEERFA